MMLLMMNNVQMINNIYICQSAGEDEDDEDDE